MTTVNVFNNNIEQALRKFKRKVNDLEILQTIRDKEHFEKPSAIKKKKQAAAKQRWSKKKRETNPIVGERKY